MRGSLMERAWRRLRGMVAFTGTQNVKRRKAVNKRSIAVLLSCVVAALAVGIVQSRAVPVLTPPSPWQPAQADVRYTADVALVQLNAKVWPPTLFKAFVFIPAGVSCMWQPTHEFVTTSQWRDDGMFMPNWTAFIPNSKSPCVP